MKKRFLSFLTAAAMTASMLPAWTLNAGAAGGDWIVNLSFREHPSTYSVFKPDTPNKLLWVEFADKVNHDDYDPETKTYEVDGEYYQLEISRPQHGPTESPHPAKSIVPDNEVEGQLNDNLRHHYHGWEIGKLFDQDDSKPEYQVGKYTATINKLNIDRAEDAENCRPEQKEQVDSKTIDIVDVTYTLSKSDQEKGYQLVCSRDNKPTTEINELAMVDDWVAVIGPKLDASKAEAETQGKSMTISGWKLVNNDGSVGTGIGNMIPSGEKDGLDDGKIKLEAVITETKSYTYDIQDAAGESVIPSPAPDGTVPPISINGKDNTKIEYSDTKYEKPMEFRIANTGNQRILMIVRGSDTFDVKLVNKNAGKEGADVSDSSGGLINGSNFLIPPASETGTHGDWVSYATLEVTPKAGLGVGTHTGTISMMEYLGNRGNMKDYTFSVTISKKQVKIVPQSREKQYGTTLTSADIICNVFDSNDEPLASSNLTAAQLGVIISSKGMEEDATVNGGPYKYSLGGDGISTGNYEVTLKEGATENGITVTKATPRRNSVRATGISVDETLSEHSNLSGMYINPNSHKSVEGEFSWVNGNTKWNEAGTYSAQYKFTPDDQENYEIPLPENVNVVVSNKLATNLRATSTKATYDGNPHAPNFTWDRGGVMRPEVLTVKYKKAKDASDTSFEGEDFETYDTEAPVEAGTYKVHATCASSDIFAGGLADFIFTIEPYTLSLDFSNGAVVKTYDGTRRAIADSGKIAFTKPKSDDYVSIVENALQGTYDDKNADAFYVKIATLNVLSKDQYQKAYPETYQSVGELTAKYPNYPLTGEDAANYRISEGPYHPAGRINPRPLTLKLKEGITKEYGQTYNFTTSDYEAAPETPLGEGDDISQIKVELVAANNADKPDATVGNYDVSAQTPSGVRNDNYTINTGKIGQIEVVKATPELPDVSAQNAYVNQTLEEIASTLKGRAQNKYTGVEVKGTLSWENPQQKLTLGSNECKWKFEPTDNQNYNNATGSIQVTAESKNPMPIEVIVPQELVYDGNQHPATVRTEVEGAPVKIEYRKLDTVLHDSDSVSEDQWTLDAPVNAGTYEVRATVSEYQNYGENVDTDTIVIDQAVPQGEVKASAVDMGAALSTSQFTYEFTGIKGEKDVLGGMVQWKNVGMVEPSQVIITSENSYSWVFLPEDPNYKTVEGTATVSVKPHNRTPEVTAVYNIPNSSGTGDYAYVNVDGENLKAGDVLTFYTDSGIETPASAPFTITEGMNGIQKVNLFNEVLSAQGGTIYAYIKYSEEMTTVQYNPELGFTLEPAEIDLEIGHEQALSTKDVTIHPTHDSYEVTASDWSTLEKGTATAEGTSALIGKVTGIAKGDTTLTVKATFKHPDPAAVGQTITVTQTATVEVTNDTFPIYTYTTNAATDITQTSAKLHGNIEINQNDSSLTPHADMQFKLWEASMGEDAAQTLGTEFSSVSTDYSFQATGLKPGTTYVYRAVGANDKAANTKEFTLATPEPAKVVSTPAPRKLTYNGEPQQLVEPGTAEGGTMKYSLSQRGDYKIDIPTGKEVGEYEVWYMAEGTDGRASTEPSYVTAKIDKANPDVTASSGDSVIYGDTFTVTANVRRSASNGIMAVSLLPPQDEVKLYIGETEVGSGTVTYTEGTDNSTGTAEITVQTNKNDFIIGENRIRAEYGGSVSLNGGTSSEIIVNMTKRPLTYEVSAAGRAYDETTNVDVTLTPLNAAPGDDVQLSAKGVIPNSAAAAYSTVDLTEITVSGGDADYYTVEETEKNGVSLKENVNITKAESSVSKPPTGKELTYTGAELTLADEGEAKGGTMQYSLDGNSYSDEVPKGKEAKEYTVYYKVKGDDNHSDTEPEQIKVTINKAGSSTEVSGDEVTYGSMLKLTATVKKTEAAGYSLMALAEAEQDKVDFYNGETLLGSAEVTYDNENDDQGTATLEVKADKKLNIGTNQIKAVYGGSVNLNGSDSSETEITMTPKPLDYSVSATSRMNDTTTVVTVYLYPKNLEGSDDVTLTAVGNVSNSQVGSYKTVDLTKIEMQGEDSEYYSVEQEKAGVELTEAVNITLGESKLTNPPTPKENLVYNGEPQALIESDGEAENGKLQYAIKEQNGEPSFSENIPTGTEAKTYTILYKVVGNEGFGNTEQQTLKVTIAKADSSTEVSGNETVTYGEDITLTAKVENKNNAGISLMSAAPDEVEFLADGLSLGTVPVDYSDGALKSKGTAELTIHTKDKQLKVGKNTITVNYGGSVNLNGSDGNTITVTMNQRPLTYDVTAEDKVYDGSNTVNVTLTPKDQIEGDDVTLTAVGAVAKEDAGSYDAVNLTGVTLGGLHGNYYTVDGTADGVKLKDDASVIISQAKPEVTAPKGKSLVYNGNPQELVEAGSAVGGTMKYSLDNKEGEYTDTIPTATKVGNYTVWYKVEANSNHTNTEPASVTAKIGKSGSDTTVDDVQAVTYGDEVKLTATVSRAGANGIMLMAAEDKVEFFLTSETGNKLLGTAEVNYSDGDLKSKGTAELTINTTNKQLAIGENTIKAVYGGSVNLNGSEDDTVTVNVGKKAIEYKVSATNKAYNNDAGVTVTLTPTNIGNDNVTLKAKGAVSAATAGEYSEVNLTEIQMLGDDAGYYSCETQKENVKLTAPVTIAKLPSNVTQPPKALTLTFNGTAQPLVEAGETSEGSTMQYSVNGETDYSPEIPTGTNAGTYIVYYKAVGDENHEDSTSHYIHVTIAKISSEVEAGDVSVEYGGELTLTAQITSDVAPAALLNNVDFFAGDALLGSAEVTYGENGAGGTATLKVTADKKLKVGENTVRAVYGGGVNLNGSNKDNITVTMTAKPLTYETAANGKAYDGTNVVDVTLTPSNKVEGDNITLTAVGTVEDSKVGTYSKLTLSDIAVGGDDAAYYSVVETAEIDLTEAIEITKAEGEATITMEDYNCGDASVEPVIESQTNSDPVITYKAKDAEDTDYSADKPLTAGEYIVRAVFPTNESYNELTVTAEFTVSHSYSEDWKSDANGHWHECVCGDKADTAAHNEVTDAAVAADCENGGKTEGSHCDICAYVIKPQTDTQALGHSWGAWTFTKTPTQTKTGAAERVCTNDETHKDVKEDIPALSDASVWTKGERVEPEANTDGYQAYTSEYGTVKETIPYQDHSIRGISLTETGAEVTASNRDEATLITASYAEDGSLVGLAIKTIPASETLAEISVELNTEGAKTVSAFMWDGISGMKPLCEAFTITK